MGRYFLPQSFTGLPHLPIFIVFVNFSFSRSWQLCGGWVRQKEVVMQRYTAQCAMYTVARVQTGEKPGVRQRSYLQWWSQSHLRLSNPHWREASFHICKTPLPGTMSVTGRLWHRWGLKLGYIQGLWERFGIEGAWRRIGWGLWWSSSLTWERSLLCKVWLPQDRVPGRELSSLDLLLVQSSYTHLLTFCLNSSTYFLCKLIY